jgi:hypothetical protein
VPLWLVIRHAITKSGFTRYDLLQGALLVCGVVDIAFLWWLTEHLTTRAILKPTNIYAIPYSTHGGTVFISEGEWVEKALGYGAGVALALAQLWLTRARGRYRAATANGR